MQPIGSLANQSVSGASRGSSPLLSPILSTWFHLVQTVVAVNKQLVPNLGKTHFDAVPQLLVVPYLVLKYLTVKSLRNHIPKQPINRFAQLPEGVFRKILCKVPRERCASVLATCRLFNANRRDFENWFKPTLTLSSSNFEQMVNTTVYYPRVRTIGFTCAPTLEAFGNLAKIAPTPPHCGLPIFVKK